MDFTGMLRRFQQKWFSIFLGPLKAGAIVAFLAVIIALLVPNRFKSTARLLPLEAKSVGGLGSLANAAAAFGLNIPGNEGSDTNFIDIINSRTLRVELLQTEFTFHQSQWAFGPLVERRQTLYDYVHQKNMDRAVKALDKHVAAYRDLKTKVLTVEVETGSADLSAQVAQKATDYLEGFLLNRNQSRGGFKASFAEKRLAAARLESQKAEETLRAFLDRNRNYQVSQDPTVRLEGMRLEADMKLHQQLIMTLAVNREQALLEEKNDVPILNVLDPPSQPIDKSWPPRSMLVLMSFAVAFFAKLALEQRGWIASRLLEPESGSSQIHEIGPEVL
jgi:uncharacterized protein involved in exopolysaccharide biosynthesis